MAKRFVFAVISRRTARGLRFDLWRLWARLRNHRKYTSPDVDRLHLGSGRRRLDGWLNVDVIGSDFDVDLACGSLPFKDGVFQAVVSQHVVEHLELTTELKPLLDELHRCCKAGASVWLSCPDLEKVCRAYLDDRGRSLEADRLKRFPDSTVPGVPSQHVINMIFVQGGEHHNLLDLELLTYLLESAGFSDVRRREERDLLSAFPEFPARQDDLQSIYVSAIA